MFFSWYAIFDKTYTKKICHRQGQLILVPYWCPLLEVIAKEWFPYSLACVGWNWMQCAFIEVISVWTALLELDSCQKKKISLNIRNGYVHECLLKMSETHSTFMDNKINSKKIY